MSTEDRVETPHVDPGGYDISEEGTLANAAIWAYRAAYPLVGLAMWDLREPALLEQYISCSAGSLRVALAHYREHGWFPAESRDTRQSFARYSIPCGW